MRRIKIYRANGLYYFVILDNLEDGTLMRTYNIFSQKSRPTLWHWRTMRKNMISDLEHKKETFKLSGVEQK